MTLETLARRYVGDEDVAELVRAARERAALRAARGGKVCVRCLETKPLADFHVDPNQKDGVRTMCKPCRRDARLAPPGRTSTTEG